MEPEHKYFAVVELDLGKDQPGKVVIMKSPNLKDLDLAFQKFAIKRIVGIFEGKQLEIK